MSRIFLVDDQMLVRKAIGRMLARQGQNVVGEAADVTAAIAALARTQADLVLVDVQAGIQAGPESRLAMQRRSPSGLLVMLTASSSTRDVKEALRWGAAGYLLKDGNRLELLEAVREVTEGRRYISDRIAAIAIEARAHPSADEALLSPRERKLLAMVAQGMSSAAIGQQLHVSALTVEAHRHRLMVQLELEDLVAVVRWAVQEGLVPRA